MKDMSIDGILEEEKNRIFEEAFSFFIEKDRRKTVIKNKSKVITSKEIKQCIDLLHSEYSNLGIKLIVYKNKFQPILNTILFKRYLDWETYKMAYKRIIGGNHINGLITLFPFNYQYNSQEYKIEKYKLFLLFDIFHEIRHAWQRIHKENKYYNLKRTYINAGEKGYSSQWIERDANQFAQRMMNKHMEDINKILNISFKWKCTWGSFKIYIK